MDKISVVIPLYNRQDLITETLVSIENQIHKPFEVIVVNDKSTDESVKVVEGYAKQSNLKIKIIDNYKKKGICGALNSGIEAATGNYIAMQDSDDLWTPVHLKQLYEAMLRYPQTSVSFSQIEVFGDAKDVVKKTNDFRISVSKCLSTAFEEKDKGIWLSNRKLLFTLLQEGFPFRCQASLIKKDFFFNNNLFFDDEITYTLDSQFMMIAAYLTSFLYVEELGLRLRRHKENDGDKSYGDKIPKSYEVRVLKLKRFFQGKDLNNAEKGALRHCLRNLRLNAMLIRAQGKGLSYKMVEGGKLCLGDFGFANIKSFIKLLLKNNS